MNQRPHIIVAGDNSSSLIVDIISRTSSSSMTSTGDHQVCFDTKYYTADVVCYHAHDDHLPPSIADSIEAVVLRFDGHSTATLDAWIPRIDALPTEVDIRLAVCERIHDDNIRSICLRHSFELIEIDPNEETRDELADCRELFGVDRVIQALRTHEWPNATMKDDPTSAMNNLDRLRKWIDAAPDSSKSDIQNGTNDDHIAALAHKFANESITPIDSDGCCAPVEAKTRSTIVDEMIADATIAKAFADVDDNKVDFEQLFSQFAAMKEIASTLTGDQRRKHAEKVTMAFWKAIGGDDDELADIIDSDDDDDTKT